MFKLVEGRVGVKLGITRGQGREQSAHIALIHPRVLQQAEHHAGVFDPGAVQHRTRPAGKNVKEEGMSGAGKPGSTGQARVEPERIPRQPQVAARLSRHHVDERSELLGEVSSRT